MAEELRSTCCSSSSSSSGISWRRHLCRAKGKQREVSFRHFGILIPNVFTILSRNVDIISITLAAKLSKIKPKSVLSILIKSLLYIITLVIRAAESESESEPESVVLLGGGVGVGVDKNLPTPADSGQALIPDS